MMVSEERKGRKNMGRASLLIVSNGVQEKGGTHGYGGAEDQMLELREGGRDHRTLSRRRRRFQP